VVVEDEPERILEAIDDRAISRLVVEDGPGGDRELDAEALASARARVVSCLAYAASGRVEDGDVRIAGNEVTEGYVDAILDPEARMERLRAEGGDGAARADAIAARAGEVAPEVRREIKLARAGLLEDGVPVETYRRVDLDEALALLG